MRTSLTVEAARHQTGAWRKYQGASAGMAGDGKVTLGTVSCNGSLRRRAENIVRTVAGVLPIDNRIVSVSNRGPAVSQSVAERYRCNAILGS